MFVKFVFISARSKLSSPLLSLPPLSPMHAASLESWRVREKGVLYIGRNRHVGPMKKVSKQLFSKKFPTEPSHSFHLWKGTWDVSRPRDATLNFSVVVTRGQHVFSTWWIVKKSATFVTNINICQKLSLIVQPRGITSSSIRLDKFVKRPLEKP